MYTLAEHCLDRIDVFQYMDHVESGLKVGSIDGSSGLTRMNFRTSTTSTC